MDSLLVLQQKRLLRVDEAAQILNVSRWTVYRWVEAGRLGGTRIGAGSLRIFSHTVAALIERHRVGFVDEPAARRVLPSMREEQRSLIRRNVSRGGLHTRQPAAV